MDTALKHSVSVIICNFWHPGTLDAQPQASECPDVKNYKWRLNLVWHRMLYSCTHMATVGVKGLSVVYSATIKHQCQQVLYSTQQACRQLPKWLHFSILGFNYTLLTPHFLLTASQLRLQLLFLQQEKHRSTYIYSKQQTKWNKISPIRNC